MASEVRLLAQISDILFIGLFLLWATIVAFGIWVVVLLSKMAHGSRPRRRGARERIPQGQADYENWQCAQCARINAPSARFCSGCGIARE